MTTEVGHYENFPVASWLCPAAIRPAVEGAGGVLLVTADHGNVEMMRDPDTGEPHTSHTTGPVYFVMAGHGGRLRDGGSLRDIAPTILDLMGIPAPAEMTGASLIAKDA